MNILELLKMRGIDVLGESKTVKLFRHVLSYEGNDTDAVYRRQFENDRQQNCIEIYQSYQEQRVLDNCEILVSFIGTSNANAQLIGVYKVRESRPVAEVPFPYGYPFPLLLEKAKYYYALEKNRDFDDLIDRVVISWGKAALSWHQWLSDKPDKSIVEIRPLGNVEEFPGFMELSLSHDKLTHIINKPEAYQKWHTALSSVAGVYLILDTKEGKQYIGSAYGKEGILGRWRNYANNGHGDNLRLKELCQNQKDYESNFKYSILHIMSKNSTEKAVIEYETLFKNKLGTHSEFGLNAN